jgi:hypothetical protein
MALSMKFSWASTPLWVAKVQEMNRFEAFEEEAGWTGRSRVAGGLGFTSTLSARAPQASHAFLAVLTDDVKLLRGAVDGAKLRWRVL